MNTEEEEPSLDIMLLPMELLYTGQFTMGSWKLPNYSLKMEQVYVTLVTNKHWYKELVFYPLVQTTIYKIVEEKVSICRHLEKNISTECSSRHQDESRPLMTIGAFSRNVGKLFSKLKLVTDNHLCCSQLVYNLVTNNHSN